MDVPIRNDLGPCFGGVIHDGHGPPLFSSEGWVIAPSPLRTPWVTDHASFGIR